MSPQTSAQAAQAPFRCIPATDAAALILRFRRGVLPAMALFDVRDLTAYRQGSVDGAIHLTQANFAPLVKRLPRTTPVLLYCYKGNASQTWAGMFADFRYGEVYSVEGGFDALSAALAAQGAPGSSPEAAACSAGLEAFLTEYAFDRDNLNAPRQHGLTPLMRAALLGRGELVAELLTLGADVQLRNMDGNNALWLACVSHQGAVVRQLAEAGIFLDNRNDMGATALMYTASAGKADMVELLLALGADPQVRNYDDARAVDLCATLPCLKLLRHTAK